MSQQKFVFASTRIEERDGAMWVSGFCPGCGERFAFRAPEDGGAREVRCPNGHSLVIRDERSAGRDVHA